MKRSLLPLMAICAATLAQGQLNVNTQLSPQQLVESVLVGSCVSVSNVTYNGSSSFTTGQQGTGSFTYTGNNLGLGAGVILTSGLAQNIAHPASMQMDASHMPNHSDPDLVTISNGVINDAAVLEFDFVPSGDSVKFRYVFASEEYPDFVCSYNDAFGFFLSGPGISGPYTNNAINIALVPGTSMPVTINNVNNGLYNVPDDPFCPAVNPQYFVNNESPVNPHIIYDGMTVVLTASAPVQCNQTYHIKLAIGDAGGPGGFDTVWDSGVFLEAGSFASVPFVPQLVPNAAVMGNTMYEGCTPVRMDFVRTSCDISATETVTMSFAGTATMGVDIVPALPTTLTFGPGVAMLSSTFELPDDDDGPETLVIDMQTIDCEGNPSISTFNFIIDEVDTLEVQDLAPVIPCGQTVELAPLVTGGYGQYTYAWTGGSTASTLSVTPNTPTSYTLVVTDLCDLTATGTMNVSFTPPPPINMSITGTNQPREGCDAVQVNVLRPQGSQGPIDVVFSTSGSATNGTDYTLPAQATIPNDIFSIQQMVPANEDNDDEGDETVTITGSYTNACSQTVTASVNFVIMDVDPLQVNVNGIEADCGPDSLAIIATVSGGVMPYHFLWNTGNESSTQWVPLQNDQLMQVTVTDDCGRTATATSRVVINCEIIIPNVFSPNGDGHNDRWVIDGIGTKQNTVKIFNRWGGVVYDVRNYRNTFNGADLPDGTYFYEVIVDGRGQYTGHLTILRN